MFSIQQKEKNSSKQFVVNTAKRKEFEIFIGGTEKWKECKILGSLINIEYDIKRRHGLASQGYNELDNIFKSSSSQESQETKLKDLNVYVESIFLCKRESSTLMLRLSDQTDCIQQMIFETNYKNTITQDDEQWQAI